MSEALPEQEKNGENDDLLAEPPEIRALSAVILDLTTRDAEAASPSTKDGTGTSMTKHKLASEAKPAANSQPVNRATNATESTAQQVSFNSA